MSRTRIDALASRLVFPLKWRPALLNSVAAVCLIGCAVVPTAGPRTSQVMDQVKEHPSQFDFVEIDPRVATVLSRERTPSLRQSLPDRGRPSATPAIGVGDVLSIAIWQSSTFGAPPPVATAQTGASGGALVIPDQTVAADGSISVPYAGRVFAADRTPYQIQKAVEKQLEGRLVQPQVIVSIVKQDSSSVTISGDEISGARVPLTVRGARLLDVIASAGGSKSPLYETHVRLTRGHVTVTVPMEEIVSDPTENVYTRAGDVITIFHAPQTFSVFGATTNNLEVPFGAEKINLAQAIAKAGGLQDARSDPAGVFLFRFEPPAVVRALGVPPLAANPASPSPVLYHLDLRQVSGYFLAKGVPMHDDDLIYVANAPMTDLQKFFTLIGTLSAPILSGFVAQQAVR